MVPKLCSYIPAERPSLHDELLDAAALPVDDTQLPLPHCNNNSVSNSDSGGLEARIRLLVAQINERCSVSVSSAGEQGSTAGSNSNSNSQAGGGARPRVVEWVKVALPIDPQPHPGEHQQGVPPNRGGLVQGGFLLPLGGDSRALDQLNTNPSKCSKHMLSIT